MRRLAAVLAAAAVAAAAWPAAAARTGRRSAPPTGGIVECAPDQRPHAPTSPANCSTAARTTSRRTAARSWWSTSGVPGARPAGPRPTTCEKTYQATKAKGVTFVGVNSRDNRDSAMAFERGRVTYPSLYDPAGKLALKLDVTQTTTPATLILDRQGRIADRA